MEKEHIIKHIFCDIDYSIFDTKNRKYIYESIEALELAHRNNVDIIIVTSKTMPSLCDIKLFDTLPSCDGYFCVSMGYGLVKGHKYDFPIKKDRLESAIDKIIKLSKKYPESDFQFVFSEYDKTKEKLVFKKVLYTKSDTMTVNQVASKYQEDWFDTLGDLEYISGPDEIKESFKNRKVYAITVFPDCEKSREDISSSLSRCQLCLKSFEGILNFTEKPQDKREWINQIMSNFSMDRRECLVIGDSMSEVEAKYCADNFISIKSENFCEAFTYFGKNPNEIPNGFYKSATLNSDDLYNIFISPELKLIKQSLIKGKLTEDIGMFANLGISACTSEQTKNIDSWLTDNDVYFLGVNGYSKVEGSEKDSNSNFYKLKKHLNKVNGNKIHVLLMDPCCNAFENVINHIKDYSVLHNYKEAYKRWFDLWKINSSRLKLALYTNEPPCFIKGVEGDKILVARFSTDEKFTDSFHAKEPSLVINPALTNRSLSPSENFVIEKESPNSFYDNMISYFSNINKQSCKYDKHLRKKIETKLNSVIERRIAELKPVLFCYSSLDKWEVINNFKKSCEECDCIPIDWERYSYGPEWKKEIRKMMSNCSCVLFFISRDSCDITDKTPYKDIIENNVITEMMEFYRKISKNPLSKLLRRNISYALINVEGKDFVENTIETILKNLKKERNKIDKENIDQKNECRYYIEAFEFYLNDLKKKGKVYFDEKSFNTDDFKNFMKEKASFKRFRMHLTKKNNPNKHINHTFKDLYDKREIQQDLGNLIDCGIRRCTKSFDMFNILDTATNSGLEVKISSVTCFELTKSKDHHNPKIKGKKEKFIKLLDDRWDYCGGDLSKHKTIKILILNPKDKRLRDIILSSGDLKQDHIDSLKEWVAFSENERYKDMLDIRVLSGESPYFKMVSCGNSNIAIQPYDNINHQIQTSPYPWIYLQKSNNINDRNSLFIIFNSLFDTLFESSKPISDIADYIKYEIEKDYKHN